MLPGATVPCSLAGLLAVFRPCFTATRARTRTWVTWSSDHERATDPGLARKNPTSKYAAAVVAGMASFTAIVGWASDVTAEMLARLHGRRCDPPSKPTIWRVVTGADADAVDAVIGA